MNPVGISVACLLSLLPGPPGIQFEGSYLSVPVDKTKCSYINPDRDVIFRLYTEENPLRYTLLKLGDDRALEASHINFNHHTVIYFHAFMENPDSESGTLIREAYTIRGHTNVIMVDGQRLESGPWYFSAADNTWFIGQYAARFIDYLVSRGLDLSNTHLIGHSLGAQSAGVAGGALRSGLVSRITGLDPAKPLFTHVNPDQRLDPSDAHFVDIIHTDAGIFGYAPPTGHVDFYPNGGISPQPGCELEALWPRKLLLEKCKGVPLHYHGYYVIEMEPRWRKKTIQNKLDQMKYVEEKLKQYFRYDKYKAKTIYDDLEASYQDIRPIIAKIDAKSYMNILETQKDENNDVKPVLTQIDDRPSDTSGPDQQAIESTNEGIIDNPTTVTSKHNVNDFVIAKPEDATAKLIVIDVLPATTVESFADSISFNDTEGKNNPPDVNKSHKIINNSSEDPEELKTTDVTNISAHTRTKRSFQLPFFNKQQQVDDNSNHLLNLITFLIRNGKNVLPVVSVMREISTAVRNGNREINHVSKEKNSYIGTAAVPAVNIPTAYKVEFGKEPLWKNMFKKMFGLPTLDDTVTIQG